MKRNKRNSQTPTSKEDIEKRLQSRRQFLIGTGKTCLFLPPLLSLMPREVFAAVTAQKAVRMVSMVSVLGIDYKQWTPAEQADLTMVAGEDSVGYKALNAIPGSISRVVNSGYSDLYGDMNVISGLSLTGGAYQGHNTSVLAGSHSGFRSPVYGKTIDVICEQSPNVYKPDSAVSKRAIRVSNTPNLDGFSFDRVNGNIVVSPRLLGDLALFNAMLGGLSSTPSDGPSQAQLNRVSVVDRVYADLKALEGNRRISSSDKELLDRYVSGINDLQKKVAANIAKAPACTKPTMAFEVKKTGNAWYFPSAGPTSAWGVESLDKMYDNYIEIFRLSAMCDLTRVMYWANSTWDTTLVPGGTDGGLHHEAPSSEVQADRQAYGIKKLADLARAFKATPDPINGGNLLENSIMFYANELGAWTTAHNTFNMPTITFGQGGGKLRSGYFIDCRQRPLSTPKGYHPGRPYKQFLQAVMASMGIPKSEYMQFGDGNGFGEFNPSIDQFGWKVDMFSRYAAVHNDPLPFFFKG